MILISNLFKIKVLVSILVSKEGSYAYWFWFRSSKPTTSSILVTISTQNIQFRTSLTCTHMGNEKLMPLATTGGQQRQTVFTRKMKLVPSAKSDTIIIANDMLKTTHNSHAEVIERIAMSCRFACFLTLKLFLLVSSFQKTKRSIMLRWMKGLECYAYLDVC